MQLWDTAGQDKFTTMTKAYLRNAKCVLLVYDTCSRETYDDIPRWMHLVRGGSPPHAPAPGVHVMLVGTGAERQGGRQVPTETGAAYAEENGIMFTEISTAEGTDISSLFQPLAERVCRDMDSVSETGEDSVIHTGEDTCTPVESRCF
ncbi:small GTPase superfamily, Ras type [Kipferlia bialata]|uniref:Small GTPase superfamily, Ras type n=1 Tax=Kipferlia bialata TaxID=797122 RepID=A0A9K3GL81_9EUKA|nr:small GTPase superfamily, Ras type [Kipferlia bialata]|eukprot:g9058.t1